MVREEWGIGREDALAMGKQPFLLLVNEVYIQ